MTFEIIHNGQNIRAIIDPAACSSVDRYGGMLDDLTITFSTESNKIEFNEGDELEIRVSGGFTTGTMYLDFCEGENGRFTVRAISCRHKNKRRKSKIWNRVKLSKISRDVAANTGLTLVTYGVEDYSYASVAQIMEPDLQMLSRVCKREGYSIKCDDGKLIIFNEYYLEHNSIPVTISADSVESNYSFTRSVNGLSSMTVRYFDTDTRQLIAYTSTDKNISGGEDTRIEYVADIYEAERVSKGYLRDANKHHIIGMLEADFNGSISAGTVADLTGFEEFDGRYVVYEVRHDYVREKTALKVRKILDY